MTPLARNVIICAGLSLMLYAVGLSMRGPDGATSNLTVNQAPVRELSAEERKDQLEMVARKAWLDYVDNLSRAMNDDYKINRAYQAAGTIGASNAAGAYLGQDPEDIRARARAGREETEKTIASRSRTLADALALEKRAMAASPRYWGLEIQRIRDEEWAKKNDEADARRESRVDARNKDGGSPVPDARLNPTEQRYQRALRGAEEQDAQRAADERSAVAEGLESKRRAEELVILGAAKSAAQSIVSKSRNLAARETNLLFIQKADNYIAARPERAGSAPPLAAEDAKALEFAQKHVAQLSKNPASMVFIQSTLRRATGSDGSTYYCNAFGELETPDETPRATGKTMTAKWCAILESNPRFGTAPAAGMPSMDAANPEWRAFVVVWDVKPKGK